MSYNWEGIPRALIAKARAKCQQETPPIALKWKLRQLLEAWIAS